MTKIETPRPIRGTQDMLGDTADRFAHVVATFERVRRLYGFRRVEVPVFESTAVLSCSLGGMIRLATIVAAFAALLLTAPAHAASNPWFGTWQLKLSNPADKPETLVYSDAGGGAMRMVSVEDKSVIVTHFDGKPAANTGAGAAPGSALAIKATSPTRYDWTFFRAGKPYVRGTNTLAADLKSFKEVSWLVADPKDVVTLLYERR